MNGRRFHERFARPIDLVSSVLSVIPKPVFEALWGYVAMIPGRPGIIVRYFFVRRLARDCGRNVNLWGGVTVANWSGLSLGSNVNIRENCYLDALGSISIGDDVSIAHACSVLAFEHAWGDEETPIKYNELLPAPVAIESDVWVGCRTVILAGATLGSRTVVGAGAVVPAGEYGRGVYVGTPCRKVREL